ncbi:MULTISPECIES: hypothetical protein [Acidiplasma]|jgi:hypothetical protein|uniref:PepSY domain-containing protein n=2 Tax=Acidiplasma TaxID=507753 RepID=A0A0Q0WKD1_9ARCH|nr:MULTISPECIES: hypothetical protein [Acidiplasma]KJE49834.1 hypothetical protein TZ01_01715 [Acidiplasma sp. MBA-1]KPV46813.1 hypothetical protein SE19_03945 [Acidiplasma aeolicum]KQB35822.1 hypothetical protein AOG54_02625 [Acidiplasma aeolicum]KQB36171.1 hypothetical protein AOG55_00390 [Acidiplasma cupricumulans]WMT54995.1 MAG: hypothetical protein RE470_08785 [Acidiplasma sp.]
MDIQNLKDVKNVCLQNIKDIYGENIQEFTINSIVNNGNTWDVSTEFNFEGYHYTVYISLNSDGEIIKFNQVGKTKIG